MAPRNPTRVVHIAFAPSPYNTPWLNALAKRVRLHVVYVASRPSLVGFTSVWGVLPEFAHSFCDTRTLNFSDWEIRAQLPVGISRRLQHLDPDVLLICGWQPAMLEPLVWSTVRRKHAVMLHESSAFSGRLRGPLSSAIRRLFLRRCDAFVACGTQAARYIESLGVDRVKIVTSCLPSGLDPAAVTLPSKRPAGGTRFLFVGRLIARKRPVELVSAFTRVRSIWPDSTLTIVGEGPMNDAVRAAAMVAGDSVRMLGQLEGADLHDVYRQCDVLVLPAFREVWGMVVNEALLHGLYVITSDQVGSAFDLIDDTHGVLVPAGDDDALVNAMCESALSVRLDASARANRARTVRAFGPDAHADDIATALELALG